MVKKWLKIFSLCLAISFLLGMAVVAAERGPREGQRPKGEGQGAQRLERQRGEGRGFDMQEMQQRMMERIKERLNVTEEEWSTIEPKLTKVMELRREQMLGRMGAFGGPERRPEAEGGSERPQTEQSNEIRKAQDALRQAIEDPDASDKDVESKVSELRDAKKQAQQELESTQNDLRKMLKPRQEAQLVLFGIID